jgi:D-sedoheptulose 7-phosphate isomerase
MNTNKYFLESADVKAKFISESENKLINVINLMIKCLQDWNKILIAWNGWSAADAQHWAAELIGRYKLERTSLPAIALTTDTSILTAIWNDYGYNKVFSKQIEWLWKSWDIFIAISTSGNSENLMEAIDVAKSNWLITLWLTGKSWWEMDDVLDYNLIVPSNNTPRIQECHMTIYHTICEELENIMFN